MHLTLHLTARCNLRCRYCYAAPHEGGEMTWETARAAIDFGVKTAGEESLGVIFFGGEPLLKVALMRQVLEYCGRVAAETGQLFHFKVTTNGLLLDEEFLTDGLTSQVFVALSHDGVPAAHDAQRVDGQGRGSFDRLLKVTELLLRYKPYAPAMLVTTPETVGDYAASVKYLFGRGFRYLICSLNYGVEWTPGAMKELRRQYGRLAEWYVEETEREQKFYFSPFDTKIASHIYPGSCRRERCELGYRQISVAPSGRVFPCVQFVGDGSDSEYSIGDVWRGIDEERRAGLFRLAAAEQEECERCAVSERCNHSCGCLNRQATGRLERVSPVLCAHEQMLMEIADGVGERLFRRRNGMFIQKQYNELFPIVSLVEDQTRGDAGG